MITYISKTEMAAFGISTNQSHPRSGQNTGATANVPCTVGSSNGALNSRTSTSEGKIVALMYGSIMDDVHRWQ